MMFSSYALAFGPCASIQEISRELKKSYNEDLVEIIGSDRNGTQAHLFMSKGGGTWTVVLVFPDDTACISESGEDWNARQEKKYEKA